LRNELHDGTSSRMADSNNTLPDRDYLTIGIGNVFASTLASVNNDDDDEEWVGIIKANPQDFVVREISPHGLVADLALTASDIPVIDDKAASSSTSQRRKRKAEKIASAINASEDNNDDSDRHVPVGADDDPVQRLATVLIAVVDPVTADELLTKLTALDKSAKAPDGTMNDESNAASITIPSLLAGDNKELRTKLHGALARAFPLLDSRTARGGQAIEITIGQRFDGLKEYLQYPVEDLSLLLGLYRHAVPQHQHQEEEQSVRLRLKEGLPRSDRRPVHQIIANHSNHMLQTKTMEEGVIEVKWAKRKSQNNNITRTLGVIKKTGCEHTAMMNALVKKLRCGGKDDLSVAGIKDMQAETYQFCVVSSGSSRPPKAIHVKDSIDFVPLGPASKQLDRGELRGNRFELVIRQVRPRRHGDSDAAATLLDDQTVLDRFRKTSLFVNYYGEQRVGEPGDTTVVGVRAPDIGKAMLQRNYAQAVDLIMTGRKVIQGRIIEVEEFRRVWKESGGDITAMSAVKKIPFKERTMLTSLKRFNDPLAALRAIPFHDRMFYINAVRCCSSPAVLKNCRCQQLSLFNIPVPGFGLESCGNAATSFVWMSRSGR
jgi:tRNA(Glu) U13 pseudouridine synthase TruD